MFKFFKEIFRYKVIFRKILELLFRSIGVEEIEVILLNNIRVV